MGSCDLCGKTADLYECLVEGTRLKTCQACASCGKILNAPVAPAPRRPGKQRPQAQHSASQAKEVEVVLGSIGSVLRKEREKRKLTQDDFAKLLSGKASTVHKVESGNMLPELETAKKWEKILGVKLTEKSEENSLDL